MGEKGDTTNQRSRVPTAVYRLAHRVDNAGLRLLDAGIITTAWLVAYVGGYEGKVPDEIFHRPWIYVGIPLAIQLLANSVARLYGPVWRFASVEEAARVLFAIAGGTLLSTATLMLTATFTSTQFPELTTPPVAALLMLLGCGGVRFQARLFALERQRTRADDIRSRTIIIGAGGAGAALARELKSDPRSGVTVVGFIDDNRDLHGRSVRGHPVLGSTDDLEELVRKYDVERVLVALPRVGRERIKAIVDLALQTDAQVKVLPRTADLVSGPLVSSLRDLDVTDLLGREQAPVDATEIAEYLRGATVLVTGAGGSIGSEISRQVARYGPKQLLLLDRDESLLHDVLLELPDSEPILVDIRDTARLRVAFEQYRPDVVFHAAAHKHVPMLERHPVEAVRTNVLGTHALAVIAAEHGCTRFVHISTDKAAKPCSVMGASKRAAELVMFEVGRQHGLPFAAVRFGNVLGSRGSVVPTFLRQILDGGPVTVTSSDMTRYFMTSAEAVSLVLQAGAMVEDPRVFLLEMGEPVAIVDLARQMIRLAGLRPGDDIQIKIIGSRLGERLHEQLHDEAEHVEPTPHPSIRAVIPAVERDEETMAFFLELRARKCEDADDVAVTNLLEQLLRRNGIDCRLTTDDRPIDVSREPVEISLDDGPASRPVVTVSRVESRSTARPAILGGASAFPRGVPFCRPARPPLNAIARRYEHSYERGILTNGPLVAELETRTAAELDVAHVVAVSSCTAGLMLALQSVLDGRPGPVVVPSFTFSASGHAVMWNGRRLRFVECDPDTFQIDVPNMVAELDGAAALLATHVFGAPCNPWAVERFGRERNVPVVFDAAHAFGATTRRRPLGSFGDAEVFSLTPTKVLVAGEGGLVATNDTNLAAELRIGRNYGNPGDYDTQFAGLNARMSEFHAAMALESLEMLDETLGRRRELAALYLSILADVPGIETQQVAVNDESTYKDFTVVVDPEQYGLTRTQLARALRAEGIETRKYFDPPLHRQTAYRHEDAPDLPVTNLVSSRVLSLPIYPDLGDDAVSRIAEIVHDLHVRADEVEAYFANEQASGERVFELD